MKSLDKSINKELSISTLRKRIIPPKTWIKPKLHYIHAIGHPWYKTVIKLQSLISSFTFMFYQSRNMISVMLPITTGSISSPMGLGSDSLPVEISIANKKVYLADSMQFMLEYVLRFEKNGVFYIMPSFRGEDSDDRHLSQFYHSEAEINGSLSEVMSLVEDYLRYLCTMILKVFSCELTKQGFTLAHIEDFVKKKLIPKIRFEQAIELLGNNDEFINVHPSGFKIINNAGEKKLLEIFSGPVWLTNHPKMSVPFYQADELNTDFSKSADLLMGIGETVGSGERHATATEVLNAIKERQVDPTPYGWYVKMKEITPLKTSGFGMGIERFILWVLCHDDIRDCQIIPRFSGEEFAV